MGNDRQIAVEFKEIRETREYFEKDPEEYRNLLYVCLKSNGFSSSYTIQSHSVSF